MTDSSNTFRDVAQKAIEDSTVTEKEEAATPEPQEAVAPEAAQPSEPTGPEAFAPKGDLQGKTAEELEEIYKNWNKAYTTKRQSETQEIKQLRAERDELKSRLEATVQKSDLNPQQAAVELQGEQDDLLILLQQGQISPAEYHQRLKQVIAAEARAIARQEYESMSSERDEAARQQTALTEVNNLDERFNEHAPTYDKAMHRSILADVGEALDEYIAQHGNSVGFDHKGVAQSLISDWNAKIDAEVKRRTQQSTQVARDAAGKFAKQNPKGSPAASAPTEGKSLRDIIAEQLEKQA